MISSTRPKSWADLKPKTLSVTFCLYFQNAPEIIRPFVVRPVWIISVHLDPRRIGKKRHERLISMRQETVKSVGRLYLYPRILEGAKRNWKSGRYFMPRLMRYIHPASFICGYEYSSLHDLHHKHSAIRQLTSVPIHLMFSHTSHSFCTFFRFLIHLTVSHTSHGFRTLYVFSYISYLVSVHHLGFHTFHGFRTFHGFSYISWISYILWFCVNLMAFVHLMVSVYLMFSHTSHSCRTYFRFSYISWFIIHLMVFVHLLGFHTFRGFRTYHGLRNSRGFCNVMVSLASQCFLFSSMVSVHLMVSVNLMVFVHLIGFRKFHHFSCIFWFP